MHTTLYSEKPKKANCIITVPYTFHINKSLYSQHVDSKRDRKIPTKTLAVTLTSLKQQRAGAVYLCPTTGGNNKNGKYPDYCKWSWVYRSHPFWANNKHSIHLQLTLLHKMNLKLANATALIVNRNPDISLFSRLFHVFQTSAFTFTLPNCIMHIMLLTRVYCLQT